jgi:hypothetical protein
MGTFKHIYLRILNVIILLLNFGIATYAQKATQSDLMHNARLQEEFILFNPNYVKMKAERVTRLRALYAKVQEQEVNGMNTECSHQILWESKALITQTANFKLLDSRLDQLDVTLAHPESVVNTREQDSLTGSWGICFEEWYCKLSAFSEEVGREENKNHPLKYQPHFLDQINAPEKLAKYLKSVSVSDVSKTGTDNLLEFNLSLGDLLRLILRDRPTGYAWDPRLKDTLKDLIFNQFRNKETGWWGESYIRDGKFQFVDDLSTTFHIVTFLNGKVPNLHSIVETTLAVKDLNYPVGWLMKGEYWNHNNMDVVALFKVGWPEADAQQRKAITIEIQKMLDWCLNESLQEDGSFKPNIGDGSFEEGVYYGTSFLGRIGFFDKSDRFWTDQEFVQADAIRKKIIDFILKHIKTGGSGGSYYESALKDYLNYKS